MPKFYGFLTAPGLRRVQGIRPPARRALSDAGAEAPGFARDGARVVLRMHSRRTARIAPLAVVALLVAAGVTATALGKGGDRVMRGSHSVDVIRGGGTAERIFGFRGNDQLFGHGGADVIVAG